MAGRRSSWLLVLLLLTVTLTTAAAIGIRVSPSLSVRDEVAEEGSGDSEDVDRDGPTLQPVEQKHDKLESKILDAAGVPSTTQAFFNYGMGFALLTYITMGISYFYGPYSANAFMANKRASNRADFLKTRLNLTDEQQAAAGEYDYGYYVGEEADSLAENDGYYGGEYGGYGGYDGRQQHGGNVGGFQQDSYVSYDGQAAQVSRVARRRGTAAGAARPGSWRAEDRRGWLNDAGAQPQQQQQNRRQGQQPQQPWRRQHQQQRQGGGGVFKVYPRQQQQQTYQTQRQTPTRQTIPASQQRQTTQRVSGQQTSGFRPITQPAQPQRPARPESRPAPETRPVLTHHQRQRQPVYRPAPAPRPASKNNQPQQTATHQRAPVPDATERRRQGPQFQPAAAQQVQTAASPAAGTETAPAETAAGERRQTDRRHSTDSGVDMVELIAGLDTSNPDCRAWIRCLQDARHPDAPLGVRRGRNEDSECGQYAAACPSKKP